MPCIHPGGCPANCQNTNGIFGVIPNALLNVNGRCNTCDHQIGEHADVVVPPPNPFSSFNLIQQQFIEVVNHFGAVAAHAAAGGLGPAPPPLVAPIFHPPNNLLQFVAPFANQQGQSAQYYQALQWFAGQGHLVADDSIKWIPVDPIFAQAHSEPDGRFSIQLNTPFGGVTSSAVEMIMRASALQHFTQQVDQYVQSRPVLANVGAIAAVSQQAINHIQPRMLVMGPQGMGKSYSMEYDVTVKRSTPAINRVIFIPHCGAWVRSSPLVYLIQCILVAFHTDEPVIAACNQVLALSTGAGQDPLAREEAVTNLLTFVAMYCQLNRLRLYMYVDQLNAFIEQTSQGVFIDHLTRFPFSILRSSIIPYWSAFGVIVVTAVSTNNNVLDEVRHFGPTVCCTFLSRYTAAESQIYLQSLVNGGMIQAPNPTQIEIFEDYTGSLPLECAQFYKFMRDQYLKQPLSAIIPPALVPPPRPPLPTAHWSTLLGEWKDQRLSEFDEMLSGYDDRYLTNGLARGRATTTARALTLRLPTVQLSPLFDRRLIFKRRGEAALHEDPGLLYLDALSPLVRHQARLHYSAVSPSQSGAASLNDAIGTMLLNTQLMTNDAKGRLVEGYILHCIREHVSSRANNIIIPLLTGGAPWVASGEAIKFKFKTADIIDFPGNGLPPISMLGDLTRPKYYFPMRSQYTEFDFFYLHPGKTGFLGKPTILHRISVTASLTAHAHNPDRRSFGQWQAVLVIPPGIRNLTAAHYTWIAKKDQNAPVTARGSSYLIDFDAMAANGFPLLANLRLR